MNSRHDYTSGITHPDMSNGIVNIVNRYPDCTIIKGTARTINYGNVSGALYHEKGRLFFLHNHPTAMAGAGPSNGIPPGFRMSYYLGESKYGIHDTLDPYGFVIESINPSPITHISTYASILPAGYLMKGSMILGGGAPVTGYLYKAERLSSNGDGHFYFLHDNGSWSGNKPVDGIPLSLTHYSWSLGPPGEWNSCNPNSFVALTGLVEHPNGTILGGSVIQSEYDKREARAREMDKERAQIEYERLRAIPWIRHPQDTMNNVVAVEPPNDIEKEGEVVLFRKHVTKKKSCDVLPMQSAVIIKTNKNQ